MSRTARHCHAPIAIATGTPRWIVESESGAGSASRGIILGVLFSGVFWVGLAWLAASAIG